MPWAKGTAKAKFQGQQEPEDPWKPLHLDPEKEEGSGRIVWVVPSSMGFTRVR